MTVDAPGGPTQGTNNTVPSVGPAAGPAVQVAAHMAAEHVPLRTCDAVRLSAVLLRSSDAGEDAAEDAAADAAAIGVVLLPGFSGWSGKPGVSRVARWLAASTPTSASGAATPTDVLVVDLRGHGASAGLSTLGDREVFDVDAAVGEMRSRGYRTVVTVGWSMGASCALRHAALVGQQVHHRPLQHPVDAVVAVSSTGWWYYRDTTPMRRLHWLVQTRPGRAVARRMLGVRIDSTGWAQVPLDPSEAAARITVPLLVVHGDRDAYLPLEHARAVAGAAGEAAELWEVPDFGHAEEGADADLVARIGAALPALVAGELTRSASA